MTEENLNKITIVRQGDVIIIPLDSEIVRKVFGISENMLFFSKDLKVVIAGEEHNHELKGDYEACNLGEDIYAVKVNDAILTHPEHGDVKLPKGKYIIMRLFDWLRRIARFGRTRRFD